MNTDKRILKLTNDDLIIGEVVAIDEHLIQVINPYSIYDFGEGPAIAPYMLPLLMEPMSDVTIRVFDIMWSKDLESFSELNNQYFSACSNIDL